MSTIKFIVEIDEQYARDHADPEKMTELVKNGSKEDFMSGLVDMVGFSSIEKAIDAGTTEFTINRETIKPEAHEIFKGVLRRLAALAIIGKKDKEEDKAEEE